MTATFAPMMLACPMLVSTRIIRPHARTEIPAQPMILAQAVLASADQLRIVMTEMLAPQTPAFQHLGVKMPITLCLAMTT